MAMFPMKRVWTQADVIAVEIIILIYVPPSIVPDATPNAAIAGIAS